MSTSRTEWARFWHRGGVEHLHARYLTHSFAPHTHTGYVIAVVEAGVQAFRCRTASYHATPGHVIFINPGEVHTGRAGAEQGWLDRPFYPSIQKLKSVVGETGVVEPPCFTEALVYDPELAAWARHYHYLSEWGSELALEEAFLELITCAVTRYADSSFRSGNVAKESGAVQQIREYLEANTSTSITLTELAHLTGLSPHAVMRAFRRQTGLTPHGFQMQRRVEAAKRRLRAGESITAVATETGFFDQSHLTKHFKRIVGVTPQTFVKSSAPAILS